MFLVFSFNLCQVDLGESLDGVRQEKSMSPLRIQQRLIPAPVSDACVRSEIALANHRVFKRTTAARRGSAGALQLGNQVRAALGQVEGRRKG